MRVTGSGTAIKAVGVILQKEKKTGFFTMEQQQMSIPYIRL
jgi:hypothetical protein